MALKKQKIDKNNLVNPSAPRGGKIFKIISLVLSLLFLLALASFDKADYAIISGGKTGNLHNWIGQFGATVSDVTFRTFGLGSYFLSLYLIIYAIHSFFAGTVLKKRGFLCSAISFMLGICILLAMCPSYFTGITDYLGIGRTGAPNSALSGGVIGQFFASPSTDYDTAGIIRRFMGTMGTCILGVALIGIGTISLWRIETLNAIKKFFSPFGFKKFQEKPEDTINYQTTTAKKAEQSLEQTRKEIEQKREMERTAPKQINLIDDFEEYPVSSQPEKNEVPPVSPTLLNKTVVQRREKPLKVSSSYKLPSIKLLDEVNESSGESEEAIQKAKETLQDTLNSFGVEAKVTNAFTGPRITRLEVVPSPGVRLDKITSLESNIKLDLKAESIRILAPIPGKDAVGIEIPNKISSPVSLTGLITSQKASFEIPVALGKNVSGEPIITDLARAPHLLIAGSTGSGKSVCINTLIISLLYRFTPEELKLILVDPKVVEFEVYKKLPHLITPIVNDPRKVPVALRWAINEMEKRYKVLAKVRVKNLEAFNSRTDTTEILDDDGTPIPKKLPFVVIVIDELADIMMVARGDVETSICRIAQKARAVGIHLVLATQRPSKEIITGVIKANLPTRIAFRVSSMIDSRVILDQNGAEALLGRGDMLFVPPGSAKLERIQGAMLSDKEIEKVSAHCAEQMEQRFDDKVLAEEEPGTVFDQEESSYDPGDSSEEALIQRAIEIIKTDRKASVSYIQRRLSIGYNKAANIIEILEKQGVIGPRQAGKDNREVYIDDDKDI
jgi:S-DNA-T family DNA segregation ATPase FtsK/SpoIIIE